MKVSYNWLAEYVDLTDVSPESLADQITLTGIEVDSINHRQAIDQLVVGEVKECQALEGSDHLNLTQVDVGQDEWVQIVCGAPNVKEGQKVIVALPGAVLPGDFEIKETKLMDQASNGMICSLDELGFEEGVVPKFAEDGIYILPESAKVGENASAYIGLDDAIIELDVTPNRADALSMRGVAHEVAAILDQKPTFESVTVDQFDQSADLAVSVESEEDTPFYASRIVTDVTIGESPLWLQKRLMAAGMRPIDSIVDITNYIMLEYGQPLHAFDYDAVKTNELYVRRAEAGEKLTTLDGKDRSLTEDDLVVTNGKNPVALAGVMGGENTHVTTETKTIAIESAIFNPLLIRKTAQRLNLRSEASSRFEKGINKATVLEALDKAALLMRDIGKGKIVSDIHQANEMKAEDKVVKVSLSELERLIGLEFSQDQVEHIFDRLGFGYEIDGEVFTVSIPPRRWDITISADLVEEVARIYGYNKIPSTLPKTESIPGQLTKGQAIKRYLKDFMQNTGFSQSVSYVLTTLDKAERFAFGNVSQKEAVSIAYPMSQDHQTLRQSLLSGLLDVAQYNKARSVHSVQLFELGSVFSKDEDGFNEYGRFAGLLHGNLSEDSWSNKAIEADFYLAKGVVEQLSQIIGFADSITFKQTSDYDHMHPGRTADIYIGDKHLGFVGQVHPSLSKSYDLKEVYVFELDLDLIIALEKQSTVYDLIPKYPGTSRDMSLLLDCDVSHQAIVDVIEANASDLLKDIHLFDLYEGDNIADDKQSLAYSLYYQNPSATLKDDEVDAEFEKVKEALITELSAEIR